MLVLGGLMGCLASADAQTISTVAGGGIYDPEVFLTGPQAVVVDKSGNLIVTDGLNYQIRKISPTGVVTTLAGIGIYGYNGDNGPANSANLSKPTNLVLDTTNNTIYFTDFYNRVIRTIDNNGIIRTFAGNGLAGNSGDGGVATQASFKAITGLALDKSGNLYVADSADHRIRVIQKSGIINAFAGTGQYGYSGDNGNASTAQLGNPMGLAVDLIGNIYVADAGINVVRKISGGIITTVAGNGSRTGSLGDGGSALAASIAFPTNVCVDGLGNLYVSDTYHHLIRKIAPNQIISTFAGDGFVDGQNQGRLVGDGNSALAASLNFPLGIQFDKLGNLYIADNQNNCIRRVNANGSIIRITYPNEVVSFPASGIQLASPAFVGVNSSNRPIFSDAGNNVVYLIDSAGLLKSIAGNGNFGFSGDGGLALNATLASPAGIVVDIAGNIFIADKGNHRIRKVFSTGGAIATIAGTGVPGNVGDGNFAVLAQLNRPEGIAIDKMGNIYVADAGNNLVRKIGVNGIITKVAGNGIAGYNGDFITATNAQLNNPLGVWIDTANNIYIADANNFRVRKVSPSGIITTLAGNSLPLFSGDGGLATQAGLTPGGGIVGDNQGNLYIADTYNQRIRKINGGGIITTIVGDGFINSFFEGRFAGDGGLAVKASINFPVGLALDANNQLYLADTKNRRLRKVSATNCISLSPSSFTTTYQNNVVNINWVTKSDAGVTFYVLQRSTDNNTFTTIDSVASKYGNSGGAYGFADTLNIADNILYYRLQYQNANCGTQFIQITDTVLQTSTPTTVNTQDTLYTKDGKLFNSCNQELVLNGVNYAAIDDYYLVKHINAANSKLNQILSSGANAVRIQWVNDGTIRTNQGKDEVASLFHLDTLLSRCGRNQVIPILCLFDQTYLGQTQNWAAFDQLITSFWIRKDVVNLIEKHKNYLIINLGNEVGLWKNSTFSHQAALDSFVVHYRSAILAIRQAGIRVPIMIDAPDFGQNWDVFAGSNSSGTVGQILLTTDPFHNIVFSVHSYWHFKPNEVNNAGENLTAMVDELDQMQTQNLTYVFGEVANNQSPPTNECKWELKYQDFLTLLQQRKIGWLAWTWNDDKCNLRQMANYDPQGNLNNRTDYGDSILLSSRYGLSKNAKRIVCAPAQTNSVRVCNQVYPALTANYTFNRTVNIRWKSTSDTSIAFYSLLRSTDSVHFITLRNFPTGFNASGNTYEWNDTLPLGSNQVYYKLAITDTICGVAYYTPSNKLSILSCNTYPLDSFYASRISDQYIQINWRPVTDANIKYYELQKSFNDTNYVIATTLPAIYKNASGSYQYLDPVSVDSGIVYYRVVAFDSICNIRSINRLSNSVSPFPPITCTPAPVLIRPQWNNENNQTATIQWTALSSAYISVYVLQRSNDGKNYSNVISIPVLPDTLGGRIYTIEDTLPAKRGIFFYRVAYIDTLCAKAPNKFQYSKIDSLVIPCYVITMNSFTSSCEQYAITVKWQPYPNPNVSTYTLERSIDNINYSSLVTYPSLSGINNVDYRYIDTSISRYTDSVSTIYYRISYRDSSVLCKNFKTNLYSDVLAVDPKECNNPPLSLFPNPTSSYLTIKNVQANSIIQVYNFEGQLLLQKKNFFTGNYRLDVRNLPKSSFFIRCVSIWTKGTCTQFIKQ